MEFEIRSPLGQILSRTAQFFNGRGQLVRADDEGNETTWEFRWKS